MAQLLEHVLAPGLRKAWPTAQVTAGGYGGTALNLAGALPGQTLPQPSSPWDSPSRSACTPLDKHPCPSPGSRPVSFFLPPSRGRASLTEALALRRMRSNPLLSLAASPRGLSESLAPAGQGDTAAPQNQVTEWTNGSVERDMEMWKVNPNGTVKKRQSWHQCPDRTSEVTQRLLAASPLGSKCIHQRRASPNREGSTGSFA